MGRGSERGAVPEVTQSPSRGPGAPGRVRGDHVASLAVEKQSVVFPWMEIDARRDITLAIGRQSQPRPGPTKLHAELQQKRADGAFPTGTHP